MTAQVREIIFHNNKKMAMCSCPLQVFFNLSKFSKKIKSPHTALWRGYVGTWEIVNGRLYLIDLSGEFVDGSLVNLEAIFPGYPERVFAHWYSGVLRIPQGELIKYVHMGFGSTYESDLFLSINKGHVIDSHQEFNDA
jgi:hypothetical protein